MSEAPLYMLAPIRKIRPFVSRFHVRWEQVVEGQTPGGKPKVAFVYIPNSN